MERLFALVLEMDFPAKQFVDFTAASGIGEYDSLSLRQPLTQVYAHHKVGVPRSTFGSLSLDLDIDLARNNPLVFCDRSNRERNSTAQSRRDELDRTALCLSLVVAPRDLEHAISDRHLGVLATVPHTYSVTCRRYAVTLAGQ